ncbi:AfsR/SARP family transcriptional regulator [Streptomyces sp. H51]|uniref:AfsR/SARP family transcriptional regulator n=1 Tax=Streptomyces sp. H51 TaxID=3111770 RepID=UPI002D794685|nr:BTAD domain-containing putative transcriptional regulator [Streptomyces sp. H51]
MALEFGLLGTIEARREGHAVDMGHLRQRCVLAVLLLDVNREVAVDALVDRVWGDRPPQRVRGTLYGYLSRLRQALAAAPEVAISRRPGGYVLETKPLSVDLHLFRDLVARARAADDTQAAPLMRQALGLWRGEPFAAVDVPWFHEVRQTLERERLAAEVDYADLRLRTGRHGELLPELTVLADEHPLDERLAGQLMLALYRCGRTADALARYQDTRRRLAEGLGTDPAPALQHLHQQILTADPALAPAPASRTAAVSAPAPATGPRQLPAPPPTFIGRIRELDHLDSALDASTDQGGTVVISAIGGAGGVGKTWLALRWAHRHQKRFPDGQLYTNLRGFDAAEQPTPLPTVVRGFLDALGAAPERIPEDLDAQTALYRSLVAGRRMLIVLDNARDADQVRPLLPGSPSCTVLVTSRSRLTALVATHGARPLSLDVFGPDDARQLLAGQLGAPRVAAEPEAVAALVEHCAGLPLALGIVAARAAAHPESPLAVLAEELSRAAERLDALDIGDLSANLRAVFAASHRALSPPAGKLFVLLGLAPGPDISLPAVASLAALAPARARALLSELVAAHLVRQDTPGRYRMHDLVRLYAAELARGRPDQDVRTALSRLVDFHLHTAFAANRLLDGPHTPFEPQLEPPTPGCAPVRPADAADALRWFDAEHECLLAVQSLALATGRHPQVWQLAWTLISYHLGGYHLPEYRTVWRSALTAAEQHGDAPVPRALAHWRFGHARALAGEHREALEHLGLALTLAERAEDTAGQAHICRTLGRVWEQYGDDERALEHALRALSLYQRLDNLIWQANQLNAVGWMQAKLGRYPQARTFCEQALDLYRRHGRPADAASTLDSLGYIAHHTGRHTQALDYYQQALTLFRELSDFASEADTLANMAETHQAMSRPALAREAWQQALGLYDAQQRDTAAHHVRRRLDALTTPAVPEAGTRDDRDAAGTTGPR